MVFEDLKIAWLQGSFNVLPMYMGVILKAAELMGKTYGAPHVYGGDPVLRIEFILIILCSPCIWG